MKKFISLFKASSKGELNVFKFKGDNKSNIYKMMMFIFLSLVMMFVSYTYADMLALPLHKVGLTYVTLTLFALAIVFLTLIETIYKSSGFLFDAKDNNLLFSMPIKKSSILTIRIIKLLLFNYIFIILFFIPCLFKYAMLEYPGLTFYLLSVLFIIVLPLIPLVFGSVIGYVIKIASSKFKNKKLVQTIISLMVFFGIYSVSFNFSNIVSNISKYANSINDLISRIYLPIGLYIDLIQQFSILKLIELLTISILPFVIYIIVFQYKYDSIINKGKENNIKGNIKKTKIKTKSIIKALTIKELKTYFSIPIYVINTIIGPILAILASIMIIVKNNDIITILTGKDFNLTINQVNDFIPLIIMIIVLVLTAMTSISSSSISLEGKKISLLKSLPIDPNSIFKSKVLTSDIIIIPFMLISSLILVVYYNIYNYYLLFIMLTCFLIPHLFSKLGLLINLGYPKLDFNTEVEVVKQSFAVLISLMLNLLFVVLIGVIYNFLIKYINSFCVLTVITFVVILLINVLEKILSNYGIKKYNQL